MLDSHIAFASIMNHLLNRLKSALSIPINSKYSFNLLIMTLSKRTFWLQCTVCSSISAVKHAEYGHAVMFIMMFDAMPHKLIKGFYEHKMGSEASSPFTFKVQKFDISSDTTSMLERYDTLFFKIPLKH